MILTTIMNIHVKGAVELKMIAVNVLCVVQADMPLVPSSVISVSTTTNVQSILTGNVLNGTRGAQNYSRQQMLPAALSLVLRNIKTSGSIGRCNTLKIYFIL
jgi:hypothetical protein